MFRNVNKLLQNIKNILQIVTKMLQFFKLFCNNYVTIKRKNKLKSKNFKLIN